MRKPLHDFLGTTRKLRKGKERFWMGREGDIWKNRNRRAAVHHAIHVFLAPVDFSARGHAYD